MNLAWKLSLVYHQHASRQLLETYDEERMPVIAEMLNLTTALHAVTYGRNLPSQSVSTLQAGTKLLDMEGAMFRPKHFLQLGVNYRWSPIVLEARVKEAGADHGEHVKRNPYGQDSTHMRAGDRAPDAPALLEVSAASSKAAQPVRLFSLFDVRRHTIIVFAGDDGRIHGKDLRTCVESLTKYEQSKLASVVVVVPKTLEAIPSVDGLQARVFVDSEENAAKMYETHDVAVDGKGMFVVVRPDGVVGAFTVTVGDVDRYFRKVLVM